MYESVLVSSQATQHVSLTAVMNVEAFSNYQAPGYRVASPEGPALNGSGYRNAKQRRPSLTGVLSIPPLTEKEGGRKE